MPTTRDDCLALDAADPLAAIGARFLRRRSTPSAGAQESCLRGRQLSDRSVRRAGRGAPAFFFAASRHHPQLDLDLKGWLSHADQFAFELGYRPADGARRALIGTPPVLSTVSLQAAMDVWADVDVAAAADKHATLSNLLLTLADQELANFGVTVASLRRYEERGGHLAYAIPAGMHSSRRRPRPM